MDVGHREVGRFGQIRAVAWRMDFAGVNNTELSGWNLVKFSSVSVLALMVEAKRKLIVFVAVLGDGFYGASSIGVIL